MRRRSFIAQYLQVRRGRVAFDGSKRVAGFCVAARFFRLQLQCGNTLAMTRAVATRADTTPLLSPRNVAATFFDRRRFRWVWLQGSMQGRRAEGASMTRGRVVVASASVPLALDSGADGSREQAPAGWVSALRDCFARIDPSLRARIVALAVSGQQHGFVPVDDAGEVLAPAKLWCDTSTSAECIQIMDAVGGFQRTIALAGNPILAGYTASKLPWTRSTVPTPMRGWRPSCCHTTT